MSTSSVTFTESKANAHAITQEGYGVVIINLKAIFDAAHKEDDPSGPYHSLINQAYSVQATVDTITAQINAKTIEVLEAEHEATRVAARVAKARYDAAKQQELRYSNAELQAQNEHSNAFRNYANLKNNPPHPHTYPSKEEIASWEKAVADAKAKMDTAHEKVVSVAGEAQTYYSDLRQLAETFNAASKKEGELRNRLNALKGISHNKASIENGLPGQ